MGLAGDFDDIRVFGILAADDELGIVSKVAESGEKIPGGAFGAAAFVSRIDLDYFKFFRHKFQKHTFQWDNWDFCDLWDLDDRRICPICLMSPICLS